MSKDYEDFVAEARGFLPVGETYCDWAASALPLPRGPPAFVPPHHASSEILEKGRAAIRHFMNDTTDEENYHIIFTSGATAAFQLLAYRIPWSKDDTFLCHRHVHNAVLGIRNVAVRGGSKFASITTSELTFKTNVKWGEARNEGFLVFAFPAECNVTGSLFPMDWCTKTKSGRGLLGYPPGRVITVVDTTKLLASRRFSLDQNPDIDALVLSLCKFSSTYTGLGALLIRKKSLLDHLLSSTGKYAYFGGQSADLITPFSTKVHVPSQSLEKSLSSGTPNMEAIRALPELLGDVMPCLLEGSKAESIGKHFRNLLKATFPKVEIHHDDVMEQSYATTSFTLLRGDSPIGHNEIANVLSLNGVHVRTGTMCNIGAVATALLLTDDQILEFYKRGHRCGDGVDLVDSKPTGLVRVSFGWGSRNEDAERVVAVLSESVGTGVERPVLKGGEKVVQRLFTYPVRGCKGEEVESIECRTSGLSLNRAFGVADRRTGKLLEVNGCPKLAGIHAKCESSTGLLTLTDLDGKLGSMVHYVEAGNRKRHDAGGSCSADAEHTIKVDATAESWLTRKLGRPAALATLAGYKTDVLVVTEDELAEVGEESGMNFEDVITAIRPNVVLSGGGVSANITCLTGTITLTRVRRCTRCKTVNTISGMGNGEPLRSIARICRRNGGGLALGCVMGSSVGQLRKGDRFYMS